MAEKKLLSKYADFMFNTKNSKCLCNLSFLLVDMFSYHSFKQSHLIQKKSNFFTAYLQIHDNIIQQISQCTSHWFYGELDSI